MIAPLFRHRVRRAFTLIELLVVITLIAVLLALLMPALSVARESSRQATCLSNLNQIGTGMMGYAMNNDGCFPGDLHIAAVTYAIWPTRIRPYLGNNNQTVFWCPDRTDNYQWSVTPHGGATVTEPAGITDQPGGYKLGEQLLDVFDTPMSYGYNDWGCGNPQGLQTYNADWIQRGMGGDIDTWGWGKGPCHERRMSKMVNPSHMIAITDKTYTPGNWNSNVDPCDPGQCPAQVHKGGCNVLFADCHAAWMTEQSVCAFDLHSNQGYSWGSPQWNSVSTLWNSDGLP